MNRLSTLFALALAAALVLTLPSITRAAGSAAPTPVATMEASFSDRSDGDLQAALVAEADAAVADAAPADAARSASLALAVADAVAEDANITAGDATAGDIFGLSVSLSGDRALVGAYGDDHAGEASGSAYVFAFDGTEWSQQAKLTAADADEGDQFGYSVSLSGDRALVGANHHSDYDSWKNGSAYVFTFDGTAWSQQARLTADDNASFNRFGVSVSLSGDHALIGTFHGETAESSGSAYVFAFDGTAWSQQAKLTADDADEGDFFGGSVSLSGDRALVGASAHDAAGWGSGSAYVFAFDGTAWSQQAKLTADDADEGDFFGGSVSLSGDRALVGAVGDDLFSGSAYVFAFDGTMWSQQAKLTADDAGEYLGSSVSLSGDRALVGAVKAGGGDAGSRSGSAYVFAFDGTAWSQQAKLTADDGAVDDNLGVSVSLSDDRALVGAGDAWAFFEDATGLHSSSAYTFASDSTTWSQETKLTSARPTR